MPAIFASFCASSWLHRLWILQSELRIALVAFRPLQGYSRHAQ
jgi:hypothetical protein